MLKQFVPNEICLKCDVCCRFREKNSVYAPKFLPEETKQFGDRFLQNLSPACNGEFICQFFSPATNTCTIYNQRPLDCRLYPLMITYDKDYENIILCLDTKCPYIKDSRQPPVISHKLNEYTEYVEGFLKKQNLPHNFVMLYQPDTIALAAIKNLNGFKTLALEHKPLFDEYFAESEYSTRSFTNIYAWSNLFNILWKIINGCLCVFYEYKNEFNLLLPPIFPAESFCLKNRPESHAITNGDEGLNKKTVLECIKLLKPNSRIENIAEDEIETLKNSGVKIHKNTDEYIYLTEELAQLKSGKFASQRAAVNQFSKKYLTQTIYRPFDIMDIDACLCLYLEWAGEKKKKNNSGVYNQLLDENLPAHRTAMMNYKELGLIGRIVEIDGKIRAYTFAFRLNKDTYCVMLETADLVIKGLAQFIYQNISKELHNQNVKYINAMDDSGLDNLRKIKLSYHPYKILPNYIGIIE